MQRLREPLDESIPCFFRYEGPLRKALVRAKFSPSEVIAHQLLDFAFSDQATTDALRQLSNSIGSVSFVPSHWRRILFRKYDFSFLLAYRLAMLLEKPLVRTLKQRRFTKPMSLSASIEERKAIMEERFVVHKNLKPGQPPILLVDDILTTGTTLSFCKLLLQEKQIDTQLLTFARTNAR
jgi:predicted amidophosphoribosyltransferase